MKIKERQIMITARLHFISTILAKIKTFDNTKVGSIMDQWGLLYINDGCESLYTYTLEDNWHYLVEVSIFICNNPTMSNDPTMSTSRYVSLRKLIHA